MNPLLAQFIPEARELLDRASNGVLALERGPEARDVINDVFRAVHTLKGTSGLFDIAPLMRLAHAAEDLLDEVRGGELDLNSEMVDNLLTSLDLIGQWIGELEGRERLPDDAEAKAAERAQSLRAWLAAKRPTASAEALRESNVALPAWISEFSEADRLAAFKAAAGGKLTAWTFDPEEDCFFRGDDPIGAVRNSPALLAVRARPNRAIGALDSLDPLQCWLRFQAISGASRRAIEEHMRYVADRIEIVEIDAADLVLPVGAQVRGPVFRDFAELARHQLATGDLAQLSRSIATLLNMAAPTSLQASALRWCVACLDAYGLSRPQEIERLIVAIETGAAPERRPAEPNAAEPPSEMLNDARRVALEQLEALRSPCGPEIAAGRLESVAIILRAELAALGRSTALLGPVLATARRDGDLEPLKALLSTLFGPEAESKASAGQAPKGAPPLTASEPARVAPETSAESVGLPRVLRVDQGKIDVIMNLVAELIVAKNGLNYLADLAENKHGSRAMAREIKDAYAVFDRITQGLQLGVMSVRMTPVSQMLQRFPRLVRDLSRALGKKVELAVEGEDTEADKNVLESLADPLIHIVRNSLDHGLETPSERLAAGKPEHGVVRISARHESDFVVIEVSDDGRGVDTARVRAKAIKVGVITAERAEQMSEQEIANLIFLPGFSTKDEVSDLSGRGVGMDVVRSTVVKAGGEVALRTRPGQGSSVVIRLPLTMAVTRIVTVDCNGRLFGIPMDLIVETVRMPQTSIRRIKNAEAFVLRDMIIPVARLAERLGLGAGARMGEDEAVMVVRVGGERIGVVVDGFRERLEAVVKPLSGILEHLTGFSGATLLGDGQVLLILDLPELL
jgi:two-component system chemotaxis sensor kinase CheA